MEPAWDHHLGPKQVCLGRNLGVPPAVDYPRPPVMASLRVVAAVLLLAACVAADSETEGVAETSKWIKAKSWPHSGTRC